MNQEEGPADIATPATWERYADLTASAMRKLASSEITLDQCYDLLPAKPAFVSSDVHDFIEDIVSEVDNDQSGFRELLELLQGGATEADIVKFMDWLG